MHTVFIIRENYQELFGHNYQNNLLYNRIMFLACLSITGAVVKLQNGDSALHRVASLKKLDLFWYLFSKIDEEERTNALERKSGKNKLVVEVATPEIRQFLEYYKTHYVQFYPLPVAPVVVIIYSTDKRVGAEEETQTISQTMDSFALAPLILKDKTKHEIVEKVRKIAKDRSITGLVVVVMAHGSAGSFEVANGEEIRIQEFLDEVMFCSATSSTPKVCHKINITN